MTPRAKTSEKTKNVLSERARRQLQDWCKANHTKFGTFTEAAEAFSKETTIPVTPANIRSAYKVMDLETPREHHKKANGGPTLNLGLVFERLGACERRVAYIAAQFGLDLSKI